MKGNEKVIQKLDQLLADELTAINQYMVHSGDVRQLGLRPAAQEGREAGHPGDEARGEADRPDHLPGGLADGQQAEPDPHRRRTCPSSSNPTWPPRWARSAPTTTGSTWPTKLGDAVSRTLLEGILKEEDEHVDWLEEQLDQIAQMGLPMYLSTQTEMSASTLTSTQCAVVPVGCGPCIPLQDESPDTTANDANPALSRRGRHG